MRTWMLVLAVVAPSGALAQGVARGVEQALAVHVSDHGLHRLGEAVAGTVPTGFPIPATRDVFDCGDDTLLSYSLGATELALTTDAVDLIATDDRLDVTVYATLSQVPVTLRVTGDCSILEDLDETCTLQVPTTAVEVSTSILFDEVDGRVDVTVLPIALYVSQVTNPLQGCTLASAVGTLLGQNPTAINDLLLAQVVGSLDEVPAQIEVAVEDALNAFAFDTTLDLLGTPLDLSLYPSKIEVSPAGLIVGMGAAITAGVSDCVDPDAIPLPTATWPTFGDTAPGTSLKYDGGVYLGRALLEELLVAVWGSGVLCMDLDELNGIPLTGAFLSAFFGEEVGALIGSDAAATLRLEAAAPPELVFEEDQPVVAFGIRDATLDLFGELDHRQARLLSVAVDADVGVDLGLVGNTIAPSVVIADDAFTFREAGSELVAPGYSRSLAGLVSTVIEPLIPQDALAEVQIPEALGIRVDELVWVPSPDDQWQGGYVLLDLSGVTPIALSGCSGGLSCDDPGATFDIGAALGCDDPNAGCADSGCATGGYAGPWAWVIGLLTLVGLRRRR